MGIDYVVPKYIGSYCIRYQGTEPQAANFTLLIPNLFLVP